ncbi:hypothetical protein QTP86_012678 [Hemibagrus guttatus]|nr:hypothetical protein QTP86_012678 [Hemibagrus guttatus]
MMVVTLVVIGMVVMVVVMMLIVVIVMVMVVMMVVMVVVVMVVMVVVMVVMMVVMVVMMVVMVVVVMIVVMMVVVMVTVMVVMVMVVMVVVVMLIVVMIVVVMVVMMVVMGMVMVMMVVVVVMVVVMVVVVVMLIVVIVMVVMMVVMVVMLVVVMVVVVVMLIVVIVVVVMVVVVVMLIIVIVVVVMGSVYRECLENGTWAFKINYSSCEPILEEKRKYPVHYKIALIINYLGHCISVGALVIAFVLFLCLRSIRCLRNVIHWNLITTFILRNIMWLLLQLIDHNIHERNEETRWKGSKARSIGAGFKLFYYGVDSKRNGVGVVLKEEFVRNVLEVKRVSDRVMSLKLEIEGVMLNVVSGYAPQVGCELEEKERFWSELDEVMESIPTGERVVIGADFNGHVGEGNTGDEEVMGKFGVKERNLEGQMVVDFAKRMDMAVVNTYFQKREEHRVTYKSGGRRTQKLRQALGGQVVLPDDWETTAELIRETGRKVLGVSSGRWKEDKETWWWNEEVQDSIQRKRLAKKKWDMDRTEENRQEYKELQRRVKREVSKAKQKAYDELYTRLDTREGEKDLYRLARQRDRDGKDVQQVRVIKDRDGRVLTSEESVQRRWKEYFEELMNEENEREKRVEGVNSVEQKVDKIRKDEVRKALKRMKSGKAVGPDDIPMEVWKCLGEAAVEFLASLFNRVLESERMPEEWRRSVFVPIFKNKGDVQSCSNYRGIKLMSHTMKLWERVVEARLRKVVEICEQQYGFMPRKSTTDAIFALRILMEKYRNGQRELHCVFVDLEKAYDRVPREELWYCMRKSGVAEKYVRVLQDMYERSRTVVRCAVGQTEEFKVEVGLHQGSALSPFLFAIVMDQLSEEVRQESPWTMMFADDIVICSESREQVEENLERWRFALERRGMKVSHSKTEYMCVNEREGNGTVRLQGEEVKKVQEFKYLGSTVQSNGECGKEVKKRVQAGWNGWRKVWGVLCDRKISARIKGKVYRTVVRPAMLYGLETVSLRKRQESELEVAELKMLRFSLGVTRLDRIRNEDIRGTAHVGRLGDKVREARLRWFGHVQRRESEYIGRRMLDMELPGRRQRGRPKRRYMDGINEDMKLVGARVEDAEDRDRWREMIRCGDP